MRLRAPTLQIVQIMHKSACTYKVYQGSPPKMDGGFHTCSGVGFVIADDGAPQGDVL
jgi:hypothetical protein